MFSIKMNGHSPPENPLVKVAQNNSGILLSNGYFDVNHSQKSDETRVGEIKESEEAQQEKKKKDENNAKEKKDSNDHLERHKMEGPSTNSSVTNTDPNAKNIEVVQTNDVNDDVEDIDFNDYFVTTIEDGEITTESSYTFGIKQLEHHNTIRNIAVGIASAQSRVEHVTEDYSRPVIVRTKLAEGKNKISITITYMDDSGGQFRVTRTYAVIFDDSNIVIETNLKNQIVMNENLRFKAIAKLGEKQIPVTITSTNDGGENEIHQESPNQYSINLKEGNNTIVIQAKAKGKQAKKKFVIHYKKPKLKIVTDLADYHNKTVKNKKLIFAAEAFSGDEKVPIDVQHQKKSLIEKQDRFHATLTEGKNTFVLQAKDGKTTQTETYIVFYEPEATGGNENHTNPNPNAPKISIFDIKDGEVINNSIRTFHVKVKNYKGESITRTGKINVTNNGKAVPRDWTDQKQISFTLHVTNGKNHLIITAEDSEGNQATKELTITGKVGNDGDPIGTATISVEATTLGLGYLIPAQKVEIYQGERASYVVDRLLKQHGYDYQRTGTLDSNFYLAAITRPGLVNKVNIPADLLETLENNRILVDSDNYHPDILGEFDFTPLSGWMYSVNGIYANVGFADYYLKDGDVLRIRFTLAYGNDIGLGLNNYHKEW